MAQMAQQQQRQPTAQTQAAMPTMPMSRPMPRPKSWMYNPAGPVMGPGEAEARARAAQTTLAMTNPTQQELGAKQAEMTTLAQQIGPQALTNPTQQELGTKQEALTNPTQQELGAKQAEMSKLTARGRSMRTRPMRTRPTMATPTATSTQPTQLKAPTYPMEAYKRALGRLV